MRNRDRRGGEVRAEWRETSKYICCVCLLIPAGSENGRSEGKGEEEEKSEALRQDQPPQGMNGIHVCHAASTQSVHVHVCALDMVMCTYLLYTSAYHD